MKMRVTCPCCGHIIDVDDNPPARRPTYEEVAFIICGHFGLSIRDLNSASRYAKLVTARHIYCYLAWKYECGTFKEIGSLINKDHTSVIHGKDQILNWIDTDDRNMIHLTSIEQTISERFPKAPVKKEKPTQVLPGKILGVS